VERPLPYQTSTKVLSLELCTNPWDARQRYETVALLPTGTGGGRAEETEVFVRRSRW
jgi:hypothetical protein